MDFKKTVPSDKGKIEEYAEFTKLVKLISSHKLYKKATPVKFSTQQLFRDDQDMPEITKESYDNCLAYSLNNLSGTTLFTNFQ